MIPHILHTKVALTINMHSSFSLSVKTMQLFPSLTQTRIHKHTLIHIYIYIFREPSFNLIKFSKVRK